MGNQTEQLPLSSSRLAFAKLIRDSIVTMSAMESEVAATAGSPVKKVADLKADIKQTEEPEKKPVENGTNGHTKSPVKEDDKDDIKNAMAKFAAGKRALLVQDSNDAVENFAEACELLGKVYGETGKELGDPYFLYGKALLEEAHKEAGVIDNAFDGEESEENSEEDEEEEADENAEEEKEEGTPAQEVDGACASTEAENVKDNESIGSND